LSPVASESVAARLCGFRNAVAELIEATAARDRLPSPRPGTLLSAINEEHGALKELLVSSVQDEKLPLRTMVERLDLLRHLRLLAEQCESAWRRLSSGGLAQKYPEEAATGEPGSDEQLHEAGT
jgi:hypothetical protein